MATTTNFHDVTSAEHFQSLLSEDLNRVSLINFWAPWAEPCKQMNVVVQELAKKYPQLLVIQVSEGYKLRTDGSELSISTIGGSGDSIRYR